MMMVVDDDTYDTDDEDDNDDNDVDYDDSDLVSGWWWWFLGWWLWRWQSSWMMMMYHSGSWWLNRKTWTVGYMLHYLMVMSLNPARAPVWCILGKIWIPNCFAEIWLFLKFSFILRKQCHRWTESVWIYLIVSIGSKKPVTLQLQSLALPILQQEKSVHMSFSPRWNIRTSIFAQQLQKLLIGHTFHW